MYSRATTSAMAERPPVLPAGFVPDLVLGAIETDAEESVGEGLDMESFFGIPIIGCVNLGVPVACHGS